jgi:hypothetical protein
MGHRRLFYFLRMGILVCCSISSGLCVGCGGGGSSAPTGGNPSPPTVTEPTLTSLSPTSTSAAGTNFALSVNGTNFIASSTVLWNGSARDTSFISDVQLVANITAADIATVGSTSVTVYNPPWDGTASQPLSFAIVNPIPGITSLAPYSVVAGTPGITLTVLGVGFVPSSTVQWNNSARPTTYVSSSTLQAAISASDIAAAGNAEVSVVTPSPGGGNSGPWLFVITSAGVAITAINQLTNDLVWDPVNQVIYLSVPSTAAANGNSIAVLNPVTGAIVSSQFAGSEPDVLAIADDSSYLYAGLNGAASVQRFVLPGLATDINYSLGELPDIGNYFALDLQIAPGSPHTTAVSLGQVITAPQAWGGITIFDDATARPTAASSESGANAYDYIQWGADATALYAADDEVAGYDFYALTVNSSGVALSNSYPGVFGNTETYGPLSGRIHFDAGTKLIYADDGFVIDPSTGQAVGSFPASGPMVPDSTLNAAFFFTSSTSGIAIQVFDLTHFSLVNTIVLDANTIGNARRLIRWGQNGLAFTTDGGVYVIQGAFVGPISDAVTTKSDLDHFHGAGAVPQRSPLPEEKR